MHTIPLWGLSLWYTARTGRPAPTYVPYAPARTQPHPMPRTHVLLIDDDPQAGFFVQRAIRKTAIDADYTYAQSVRAALERLRETPTRPTHILLDINLRAGERGWDFLDALAEEPELLSGETTVYMLSSSNNPNDFARAEAYPQVRGYIEKHLDVKKLQQVLA